MGEAKTSTEPGRRYSRRKLLLASLGVGAVGGAAIGGRAIWRDKDLAARLFNPYTLKKFALAATPGLATGDGQPIPGFSTADLADKRSILHFWASWCPNCQAEHAVLVELASRRLAPIYGVDVKDDPERARAYLAAHGNPFDAVGADPYAFLEHAMGVRGVPATFVIGPGPTVEVAIYGPLDPEIIAERIVPAFRKIG